jgi:hypothetical protein
MHRVVLVKRRDSDVMVVPPKALANYSAAGGDDNALISFTITNKHHSHEP